MPDPIKISFIEWWKYEYSTIKRAWSEIRASIFVRGGTVAVITAVLAYWGLIGAGASDRHEIAVRYVVSACAGLAAFILVFGVEFLFKLLRAPAKMAKEAEEKFVSDRQQLEMTIEMLKSQLEPSLSDSAVELLVEAVKGGGSITYMRGFGGITIHTNNREFVKPNDQRTAAKWKGALDELVSGNYVEYGEMFYPLTAKGYAEADRLKTLENKGENK